MENLRPVCGPCNFSRGNRTGLGRGRVLYGRSDI
ncbi:hypothetical protein ABZ307_23780 [Streptomyces griseorubiginosus]